MFLQTKLLSQPLRTSTLALLLSTFSCGHLGIDLGGEVADNGPQSSLAGGTSHESASGGNEGGDELGNGRATGGQGDGSGGGHTSPNTGGLPAVAMVMRRDLVVRRRAATVIPREAVGRRLMNRRQETIGLTI